MQALMAESKAICSSGPTNYLLKIDLGAEATIKAVEPPCVLSLTQSWGQAHPPGSEITALIIPHFSNDETEAQTG